MGEVREIGVILRLCVSRLSLSGTTDPILEHLKGASRKVDVVFHIESYSYQKINTKN